MAPGAALAISGAQITGPVTSDTALAITVCQSSVTGPLTIQHTTGYALIGADPDDAAACAGNTVMGPLTLDE